MVHLKKTKAILCVLNTDHFQVKNFLEKNDIDFTLIADIGSVIPNEGMVGFTTSNILIDRAKECVHPPILFDTAFTISQLALETKIIILDGVILPNGVVFFTEFRWEKLLKAASKRFVPPKDFIFRKSNMKQFGAQSSLTKTLSEFLVTIPGILHPHFYVSLATAIENNKLSPFRKFVRQNRLVTDQNLTQWTKLVNLLSDLVSCAKGERKWSQDLRKCFQRMKFLIKIYGAKPIKEYLKEINLGQEK